MQHLCNFRIHPTERGHALRRIRLIDLHPAPDLHNFVLVQLGQQIFRVLDWHLHDARNVCVDQRGTLLRAHRRFGSRYGRLGGTLRRDWCLRVERVGECCARERWDRRLEGGSLAR